MVFWERWRPSHPPINAGGEIMDACTNPGVHFLSADLQRLITCSRDAQGSSDHEICREIAGEPECAGANANAQNQAARQPVTRQTGNSPVERLTSPEGSSAVLIRIRRRKSVKAAFGSATSAASKAALRDLPTLVELCLFQLRSGCFRSASRHHSRELFSHPVCIGGAALREPRPPRPC